MTTLPSLDIIVVNWNSGRQLKECLCSIQDTNLEEISLLRVIVVDNGSTDGSIKSIDVLGLPLEILKNERNMGFSYACNQGARDSDADYLLFLNPDTRLFVDSLRTPIIFMEKSENSTIAICGVQLLNDNGSVSRSCARFPSLKQIFIRIVGADKVFPKLFHGHYLDDWDHKHSRLVDQVMGAFFLVRRNLYEQLQGFDERFFVYYEEVDFSYRASLAGWQSYYHAGAQVYHKRGGSSEQVKANRLFYSLLSRILYSFKHFSRMAAIAVLFCTLLVEPGTRLMFALSRHSLRDMEITILGYLKLWKSITAIIIKAVKSKFSVCKV